MIKYTKTETTGEVQTSESVELETFDQLLDYLRKDDVVNDIAPIGDSDKQKDLLDDKKQWAKEVDELNREPCHNN